MAQSLQLAMDFGGGEANPLSRASILGRYRRYSAIRKDVQSAALESVAASRLLAHAKRIGLSDGKVLFADDDVELSLVFDLAVYTSESGRTRAIDRCARKRAPIAGPEEALVLNGLQASRFSVFVVVGKCEPAGVLLKDLLRGEEVVLLDEGMEQSADPGGVFAIRVAPIEDFVISSGAIVPLDAEVFEEIIDFLTDGEPDAELASLADDRRFAASVYELAIELGMMDRIAYR
jgi:hypothetical protein